MPEVAAAHAEVREVLGVPADRAVFEPLTHDPRGGGTAGVWRVGAGGRSAVLKVLTRTRETSVAWSASNDPRHPDFWRREAWLHRSGLARLWQPHGIRAPRLLECVERPDGDVALWLEDVRGEPATAWSPARHTDHAHRLGAAQGAVGAGEDAPWLSQHFLRDRSSDGRAGEALLDDEAWRHPRVREHVPPGLREDMLRLHHDRSWLLTVMESLPRAFSHLDHRPARLVRDGAGASVLLDWAFAGDGALGEDLGAYLPECVLGRCLPAAGLPGLAKTAYDAYLDGLRASGWRGDEHLVRLGVCASAVRYGGLAAALVTRTDAARAGHGTAGPLAAGVPPRELALVLAYVGERVAEARILAPQLGFPQAPSGR
ncbi:aminoglycoside phosphotransferase [Streptomyces sp. NPDC001046]|uniref:aminoglycoside phosphotransferase n=1 Tax=Streptomyces sp. NPDC001046 TaxID=3364543 RepID=UPI0036C8A4A1